MNSELPSAQPRRSSFNWQTFLWILLIWMVVFYLFRGTGAGPQPRNIAYTQFKERVRQGEVTQITIRGQEIHGEMLTAQNRDASAEQKGSGADAGQGGEIEKKADAEGGPVPFKTVKPAVTDPGLMTLLENHGVVVKAELEQRSWFWRLVVTLLPWVLIIGFFVYSSRKLRERMGGIGQGGPFGFAKSKAKRFAPQASQTTFDDVAGLDNAKQELTEVVDFLKEPSKFERLGGQLPKGMLFVGPPGVGKTLMAQAMAGEADVPFFSISGSEFIEMLVGVGASRVRDMFAKAKKEAPSVIFIDELDSIGRARGAGVGGGHDEREQTLNQILSEMDGFSPHESVVVLAATNRPDVLDPALVRPGRFDRRITLDMPRKRARHQILKIHARDKPLADDADLARLAERTVGFSGADLRNLVNEAALLAARKDKSRIGFEDFDEARDKIMMGLERDELITEEEKEMIAYHEAGHALVAALLPGADPLQKVTIIPRGGALGVTEQTPEKERYTIRRKYLLDRIAIMLGGRSAERIKFDDISTGAGDDLKKATDLARRMVCQWGMSDEIGPVVYKRGEQHPFLGRELAEEKDFSEQTARLIDQEIKRITVDMEKKATALIEDHRDGLETLAQGLIEHETLSREEIESMINPEKEEN